MSNRAERRHHKDRMKAKARRVALHSWGYDYERDPVKRETNLKRAEKLADHLKTCSCSVCCNLRSKTSWCAQPTRQEVINYIQFLEETGMEDRVKYINYRW
jgi:hypothetical protein